MRNSMMMAVGSFVLALSALLLACDTPQEVEETPVGVFQLKDGHFDDDCGTHYTYSAPVADPAVWEVVKLDMPAADGATHLVVEPGLGCLWTVTEHESGLRLSSSPQYCASVTSGTPRLNKVTRMDLLADGDAYYFERDRAVTFSFGTCNTRAFYNLERRP